MSIAFFVEGTPKSGGSKKGFYSRKLNRVMIVEDCKGNKDWRSAVMVYARNAYKGLPLVCPIAVRCAFYLRRPKSHYRANGTLKPTAPRYPAKKPDATKLWRSTEDALTDAGIWRDDAQVVIQHIEKVYADAKDSVEGAMIVIKKIEEH